MTRQRIAAVVTLLAGAATAVLAIAVAVNEFPRGLVLLGCVVVAAACAWYGALRRGIARVAGLGLAALALAGALVLLATGGTPGADLMIVVGLLVTLAASRASLAVHVDLPGAPNPQHPVLFYNPKSGGGKSERFHLADEARKRGIEPIEFGPPWDLDALVRGTLGRADALAMAGGDGSQAIVAAIAAEHDLPYACIPAGTRNHFALDLGVDRDDVIGALDAFNDAGERTVDLAEINGRVFVNNVSLGLYAEAVQHKEYRDAKLRTLLDTVPDVLGPSGGDLDLRWEGPGGQMHHSGAMVLVSNNQYRLGRAVGSGTRPRIDDGLLGITAVAEPTGRGEGGRALQRPLRAWSAPTFEVDADRPIAAGIDGEALVLDAPLRFRIRPGVLRVRIARKHPGASPSAMAPEGVRDGIAELVRIALGHHQEPADPSPAATNDVRA